ncbi:MAG TPA: RNA 2',3'-cyclic phosphodiesterase [Steroidobacteraceae bacterium]|nr:RNA 2',3'-cyclic phosphodiesterase [Steroidobacteraceae bacterium]
MTSAAATSERTQRLFFALWPQDEARATLVHAAAKAVRHSGGRPVPAANLHVTLAFLGTVPERRTAELQRLAEAQALACAREQPIALTFERFDYFRRAQVLCVLAAEEDSAAVRPLASALQDASAAAGFNPDLKPFRAHVTVARKVMRATAPAALRAVVWKFSAFALVSSRTEAAGPVYSVVESYPLVKTQKAHE